MTDTESRPSPAEAGEERHEERHDNVHHENDDQRESRREESPNRSLKRRASPSPEAENKRSRVSLSPNAPTKDDTRPRSPEESRPNPNHNRRGLGERAEERKRGQRLFSALLGNLSRSTPTAAQKRRSEIDKKQQAKLRLQEEKFNVEQRRQLDKLLVVRRREQGRFEEQAMKVKHRDMRAAARFLRTKAEPRLYYKPWKLSAREEDEIAAQQAEVEAAIEKELQESGRRERSRSRTPAASPKQAADHENEMTTENEQRSPDRPMEEQNPRPQSKDDDEGGDMVMEAGDDAVMY